MTDIVQQARTMAAMLVMGERIPHGADANILEALAKEVEGLRHQLTSATAKRVHSQGEEGGVMDKYAGKTVRGEVCAGEFVGADDEDGRDPGVYITIKLTGERKAIVGGPVSITYLPLPPPPTEKE